MITMRLENSKDKDGVIIVAETPIDNHRLGKTSDTRVVNQLLNELEVGGGSDGPNIMGVRSHGGLTIIRNDKGIKEDLLEFFARVAWAFPSK